MGEFLAEKEKYMPKGQFLDEEEYEPKGQFLDEVEKPNYNLTDVMSDDKKVNNNFIGRAREAFKPFKEAYENIPLLVEPTKKLAQGTEQMVASISGLLVVLGDQIKPSDEIRKQYENMGKDNKRLQFADKVGDYVKRIGQVPKEFWTQKSITGWEAEEDAGVWEGSFIENPSWTRAFSLGAGAVPSIATSVLVGSVAGPVAAVTMLGMVEGEPVYEEAIAKGKTPDEAFALFGATAVAIAATEWIPMERFLKGGSGKLIKDIVVGGLIGGTQEGTQQIITNFIRKHGIDKTTQLLEGVVDSIIGGLFAESVTGGVTSRKVKKVRNYIKTKISDVETKAEELGLDRVAVDNIISMVADGIVTNSEEIDNILWEEIEGKLKEREALTKEEIAKKEEANLKIETEKKEALNKVANLAQELGIEIENLEVTFEENIVAPDSDQGRELLKEAGYSEEEVQNVINEGKRIRIAGEHKVHITDSGQRRSNIRLYGGHSAKDIYHEFAHAVEEQGGLPGWAGTKEQHAQYLENILSSGEETKLPEFRSESSRVMHEETVELPEVTVTDGAVAVDLSDAQNSVRTVEDSMKAFRQANEKSGLFTDEEIDTYFNALNNVTAFVLANKDILDYAPADYLSAVKVNSDPQYKKSLDFTTMCIKRYVMQSTIDAIQIKLDRPLLADDYMTIRKMMQEMGLDTSCGACYVDSRRIHLATVINKALNGWTVTHKDGTTEEMPPLKVPKEYFLTVEGFDKMAKEYPAEYKTFRKLYAGTQMKVHEGRTEYRSEISKFGKDVVDTMNQAGGMRWQSWSDFELPHLLDGMQAIGDMAQKKLKGHAYTKVTNFVRSYARTGMMINMSLIPKGTGLDKNGNLIFDEKQSFDFEEAMRLRAEFPNVGTVAIGISDEHIKALLADDRIDYVIPYHASGLSEEYRKLVGMDNWTDYTEEQNWMNTDGTRAEEHPYIHDWKGEISELEKIMKGYNKIKSGININDKNQNFTEQILEKEKKMEIRDSDSLSAFVGKTVGIIRTGQGKAQLVGYAYIGRPKVYKNKEQFRKDEKRHKVSEGSEYDIKEGGVKYGYPLKNIKKITPIDIDSKGIVSRDISSVTPSGDIVPPFENMREFEGYEKLLTDRRIWDNDGNFIEQQAVKPVFDDEVLNEMLASYESPDYAPNDEIVEKMTKKLKKQSIQRSIREVPTTLNPQDYASLEEFVKAQVNAYRGVKKGVPVDDFDRSKTQVTKGGWIWFSPDKTYAEQYKGKREGGNLIEAKLSYSNPFVSQRDRKTGRQPIDDLFKNKTSKEVSDDLQSQGYDALEIRDRDGNIQEIGVYDKSQIKTKAELTDIYNKAQEDSQKSIRVIPESKIMTELKTLTEKINEYTLNNKKVPDSLLKKQQAIKDIIEVEGKSGKNIPVKKLLGIGEQEKVTISEMKYLKERLQSFGKGFKEGVKEQKLSAKQKQETVIKMLEDAKFLNPADRASFIRIIKNIPTLTDAKLQEAMDTIAERIEKKSTKRQKESLAKEITKLAKAEVPQDYRDQIDQLLEGIELKSRSEKTKQKRENILEFLERQQDEGSLRLLPKEFFNIPTKTLDQMSVEELENIKDQIDVLVTVGTTKGKLLTVKKTREIAKFVDNIVNKGFNEVGRTEDFTEEGEGVRVSEKKSKWMRTKEMVSGFFAAHRKIEYIMKFLNGLELTDMVKAGRTKSFMLQERIYPKLGEALKKVGDLNKFMNEEGIKFGDVSLTREQMVGVVLNSGNQGNLERIVKGNKISVEQIEEIKTKLTEGEKAFIEDVFNIVEELYPEMSKTTQNLTGLRAKKILGRYFPIVADIKLSKRAELLEAKNDLFQDILEQTWVAHSFAKGRIGGSDAVDLGILGVITNHIDGVIHYISFAEAVNDVQQVITNPRFRNMIETIYDEQVYEQFPYWLKTIANPKVTKIRGPLAWLEKSAKYLRTNATTAQLGIKLTVSLVQAGSFTQTMNEVGTKQAMNALGEFISDRKGVTEFAFGNSAILRNRQRTFDRDLKDDIEAGKFDHLTKGGRTYKEMLFYMIQTIDMATTIPTWLAAYNKSYDETQNKEEAIRYADHVVTITQPSGLNEDLSAVMKGPEFMKLWTSFMSHFANVHNQITFALDELKMGKDHPLRRIGTFGRRLWFAWLLPAFVTGMLKNLGNIERTLKDMIAYPFGGMIIGRDLINMVKGFALGSPPAFASAGEAYKAIKSKSAGKVIKHGVKAVGILTGKIPVQAVDTAAGAVDLFTGDTDNWMRLIFSEWSLTGGKEDNAYF